MGRAVRDCAGDYNVQIATGADMQFDVIVDFSAAVALDNVLALSKVTHKPVVIASTGHSDSQKAQIAEHARDIAVLHSPNMSCGIGAATQLARLAARLLDSDIEIIETHHCKKHDVPSGTANMLANAIASVRDGPIVVGRDASSPMRVPGQICIHSIRGGSFVGQHTVMLLAQDETITISHQAHSRTIFAIGALRASMFLCDKQSGLYDMSDVLGGAT
jgi:4-hydroxy-tetrahydrodipicolinate reductase